MRIIHTADVHFGMENYGKIDLKTGINTRLLDFKCNFDLIVEYAIENFSDCFIFAGDAYKNNYPSTTHQKLFLSSVKKLLEHNIPVVIISGNHDQTGNLNKAHPLELIQMLTDHNCYVFNTISSLTIQTKSGPLQIAAVPWPNRHFFTFNDDQNALHGEFIKRLVINKIKHICHNFDHSIPSILVGHLTVEGGLFSGSERTLIEGKDPIFSIEDIAIEPFDYVALGHLHRHQNINPQGYPAIVYSGSPEKIDFGEKHDEKGFCDVFIPKKNKAEYRFIPLKTRPMHEIYITIDSIDSIIQTLAPYNLEEAIIKVFYTIEKSIIPQIATQELHNALKNTWHIAQIAPIFTHKESTRRASLHYTMPHTKSISELVLEYCKKDELYKHNSEKYCALISEYNLGE